MAYHFDPYDGSLVLDGVEKGVAESPFNGIADMRNANIISVPGEASVNFKTTRKNHTSITSTGSVTSADAGTKIATLASSITGLETGMAITFSAQSGLGVTINTVVYWVEVVSPTTIKLYSNMSRASIVNVTNGTGTFSIYNMGRPMHFAWTGVNNYLVDHLGRVWSDIYTTTSGYWGFTGNIGGDGNANGNGLVFLPKEKQGTSYTVGTGWLFVFRNSAIDYTETGVTPSWSYGWKPSTGTTANASGYLETASTVNNSHEARLMPTNQIVYCDKNYVGRFYQKDPATLFSPTNTATYVWDSTALLPGNDIANCLEYLGTNILVGGSKNVIYPWNGFSSTFQYPILCAEYNIQKLVTVNTNCYIFIGNRGRIYLTNGTNVTFYKKIPDAISGTVEPYFSWGGACLTKNQIYFSANATTNAGAAITQYGGVWAIDVDTSAMRLTNKLSYDTYAGYASAIAPNFANNPAGAGLFIGWDNGSSVYGLDATSSNPYSNGETTIDFDLIPVGTLQNPRNFTKVEYRLTRPLVTGESVQVRARVVYNTSDTGYSTISNLTNVVGEWSGIGDININNAQWVQFQAVLTSTNTNPSYVRLKEVRILGLTGLNVTASERPTL